MKLDYKQCLRRYPRLARAIQWIIIGSAGETGCCIRDYRDGLDFSCEAVSHSGLTPHNRICHAITMRANIRRLNKKITRQELFQQFGVV